MKKVKFINSKDVCNHCGIKLKIKGSKFCSKKCKDIYENS